MISELDKAYAAGLFDGEGSVGVYWHWYKGQQKGSYRLEVQLSQKDKEPHITDWLQQNWGGSTFSYQNGVRNWVIFCKGAGRFLADILPYSKVKRDQIEIAVEFQSKMKYWGRAGVPETELAYQKDTSEKLKLLKQL